MVAVLPLRIWVLQVILRCTGDFALIDREKDPICVAGRTLLFTSIVLFAVLVVLESRQEGDLLLMEPAQKFVCPFGHQELIGGDQRPDIVLPSELLRREIGQVAPVVHVTKDELVILL